MDLSLITVYLAVASEIGDRLCMSFCFLYLDLGDNIDRPLMINGSTFRGLQTGVSL